MIRLNAEGIPRDELLFTLRNRRAVADARRIDACLLCRRNRVNAAGLCDLCYSGLDGEELKVVTRLLTGVDA